MEEADRERWFVDQAVLGGWGFGQEQPCCDGWCGGSTLDNDRYWYGTERQTMAEAMSTTVDTQQLVSLGTGEGGKPRTAYYICHTHQEGAGEGRGGEVGNINVRL